ncbi:MAG: DUF6268 family outer membrane beta-barrel protein [Bacteroidota bacterium]
MRNKIALIISGILVLSKNLEAQPYVDIISVKASVSPSSGNDETRNMSVQNKHYIAGAVYPFKLKDSSKIILGLYNEGWIIKSKGSSGLSNDLRALIIPVGFVKPLHGKWSIATTLISRWNGETNNMFNKSFQVGGTLVAACKKDSNLTFRFGAYYNSEFFGPFIIPLLGIDWKITQKDNLFGLLPQQLTYEHKLSGKFYWGAVYRMVNNSFRTRSYGTGNSPSFVRINEMQLLLSADLYLSKRIVFNVEAGHSVFRKIRLGVDVAKKDYYQDDDVNDGFLFKAGLLYRVRLR